MEVKDILSKCDYTLLDRCAKPSDIATLIEEGSRCGVASVCIAPFYVEYAKRLAGNLPICTVVGFPNGYNTLETKLFEAENAIKNGADEIDAVINVGQLKADVSGVRKELAALRKTCKDKVLKIIIEACLLSDSEKEVMCELVAESGADFIKTSTGFSTGGATEHDVRLLFECAKGRMKVKAAGGIRTVEEAERFISLGAARIGTSKVIKDALKRGL